MTNKNVKTTRRTWSSWPGDTTATRFWPGLKPELGTEGSLSLQNLTCTLKKIVKTLLNQISLTRWQNKEFKLLGWIIIFGYVLIVQQVWKSQTVHGRLNNEPNSLFWWAWKPNPTINTEQSDWGQWMVTWGLSCQQDLYPNDTKMEPQRKDWNEISPDWSMDTGDTLKWGGCSHCFIAQEGKIEKSGNKDLQSWKRSKKAELREVSTQ